MLIFNNDSYLLRNYLESVLRVSKLSSTLGVWSLCAISNVLMMKVNASVNFK